MQSSVSRIAIIPARGGSKRIPRKNIRNFRGKPIIAWSIEAALNSGLFDEVMVSTDDLEIAEIAMRYGASVPFHRSAEASGDHATTADALFDVFKAYRAGGRRFDYACCIYPTAPFVSAEILSKGLDLLTSETFSVVMPVTRFSYPIWRSLRQEQGGRVTLNFPENRDKRSQDLTEAYHDAGQWYWFDVDGFLQTKALFGDQTGSIILPETHVQDIDTEQDWAIAELKHERLYP